MIEWFSFLEQKNTKFLVEQKNGSFLKNRSEKKKRTTPALLDLNRRKPSIQKEKKRKAAVRKEMVPFKEKKWCRSKKRKEKAARVSLSKKKKQRTAPFLFVQES